MLSVERRYRYVYKPLIWIAALAPAALMIAAVFGVGPFELGELGDGEVKEIESQALRTELGEKIVTESGADFDAPLVDHDARPVPPRHLETRAKRDSHEEDSPRRGYPNDKKKKTRRDRTGGPRPKYPRQK